MTTLQLKAEPRTSVRRGLKELRDQGYVPGVLYGHGVPSQTLQIEERALTRLLALGGGHSLISLSIAGTEKLYTVLVREIQRHPTQWHPLHVDFYTVVMTEKLQTDVPLVIVGESPAVVEGMAALVQIMDNVEVECLPGDLPSSLDIDVSGLERTDQTVCIGDIVLPEGVEILEDPKAVVISLGIARAILEEEEEEEEEEIIVPEADEVEVVAKGKAAKDIEEEEV